MDLEEACKGFEASGNVRVPRKDVQWFEALQLRNSRPTARPVGAWGAYSRCPARLVVRSYTASQPIRKTNVSQMDVAIHAQCFHVPPLNPRSTKTKGSCRAPALRIPRRPATPGNDLDLTEVERPVHGPEGRAYPMSHHGRMSAPSYSMYSPARAGSTIANVSPRISAIPRSRSRCRSTRSRTPSLALFATRQSRPGR